MTSLQGFFRQLNQKVRKFGILAILGAAGFLLFESQRNILISMNAPKLPEQLPVIYERKWNKVNLVSSMKFSDDNKTNSNTTSWLQSPSSSPTQKPFRKEMPFQEFPYAKTCKFELPPQGIGTSYEIALFYHVGMMKNWKNIVRDQLHTLDTCGLGYMASSLTMSYANGNSTDELVNILNEFTFTQSLPISFIQSMAEPWETEIMASIARTCQTSTNESVAHQADGVDKRVIVYYFHSKGCSRYSDDWPDRCNELRSYCRVLYWRKYLEWFLLERPTICLRAILNHGASTCGVNLHNLGSWHYNGNFWAASCDWIKTLLPTVDSTNYIAAELWIGLNIPMMGWHALNHTKHATLFETWDITTRNVGLYQYLILPDQYAFINEAKTQGRYSGLWLDYLAGLEEGASQG